MAIIASNLAEDGSRSIVTKVTGDTRFVSCTCCESPFITCCICDTELNEIFLPTWEVAQDLMPAEINFEGTTLSLGTLGYGNTTNGVFYEDGTWAVYKQGVRTTRRCLISDVQTDIQDKFPATLSFTFTLFGETISATLSRTGDCLYEGVDNYECAGTIQYGSGALTIANNWVLTGFSRVEVSNNLVLVSCGGLAISQSRNPDPVGTFVDPNRGTDNDGNPVSVSIVVTTP